MKTPPSASCTLPLAILAPVLVTVLALYINQHLYHQTPTINPTMDHQNEIQHNTLHVNGIAMHVAEKGSPTDPVVLFIHGFPELWYSWRHQIHALAANGYRAIAPDLRGFGDTEAPGSVDEYGILKVVGDLVALIDAVAGPDEKVFVVGHDWGAFISWFLCLFRPDRVKALVNMSVLFSPRNPAYKPLPTLKAFYGDDYYVCRFQVFIFLDSINLNC